MLQWKLRRIGIDIFLIIAVILLSLKINTNAESVNLNTVEDKPIYCVETEDNDKSICLTFDVNWAEKDNLTSILDILDKYNVKGTFFVMGGWVNYSEENIEKLKDIDKRGNEIGNHSYMHPSFTKINESKMKEELSKTDKIIEDYTGKKPKIFRFPSGDYNRDAFFKVRNLGYMAIQWSNDSVDWKEEGKEKEYNRVMKNVKPGAILLFHNNAKYTPENLDELIPKLQSEGYEFKTISEMIYFTDYSVDENGVQHKNN